MRVLLIEDDELIGDGIKTGLEKMGFTVDWFQDGDDGEEALLQAPYDAVVLDLGLPQKDGLEILESWRNAGKKEPVLILSARGDIDQRILGLNLGADDYLAKPFSLKEVQARLNALIRRQNGQVSPQLEHKGVVFDPQTRRVSLMGKEVTFSPKELVLRVNNIMRRVYKDDERIFIDGYEIDENQRVVYKNNVPIDLTTKEFDLLMLFVKNKGTAFLREQILTKVWDENFYGSDRVVDDTLRRLRKKMPKINIQTIYGFGYRLG